MNKLEKVGERRSTADERIIAIQADPDLSADVKGRRIGEIRKKQTTI
ncbi:MAG: hypothetical protein M3Q91_08590 [Acidobacteriota bacterium]|nr:hypothetical protein [Acidobacteriota bacterium]